MKKIIRLVCLSLSSPCVLVGCAGVIDHDTNVHAIAPNRIQNSVQIGDIMTGRQFALYNFTSRDHYDTYNRRQS